MVKEGISPLDINEWHERYIKRLEEGGDLSRPEAEDALNAGIGEYDYNDSPEDCADEEISYWTHDE